LQGVVAAPPGRVAINCRYAPGRAGAARARGPVGPAVGSRAARSVGFVVAARAPLSTAVVLSRSDAFLAREAEAAGAAAAMSSGVNPCSLCIEVRALDTRT